MIINKEKIEYNELFFTQYADVLTCHDWTKLCSKINVNMFSIDFFSRFKKKINWSEIFYNKTSDCDFLRKTINLFDFKDVPDYFQFDKQFITDFIDVVNWNAISLNFYEHYNLLINTQFLIEFSHKINWTSLSLWYVFSEEEFDIFFNKIDWEVISINNNGLNDKIIIQHFNCLKPYLKTFCKYNQISQNILYLFAEHFPYDILCRYQKKIPEDFINKFKHLIDWKTLCKYQEISEELIEKNINLIDWESVSFYQKISLHFIQKNIDNIYLNCIGNHTVLTDDFIVKYQEHLNWNIIVTTQELSTETLQKCKHLLNWSLTSKFQKMSPDFIIENASNLNLYNLKLNKKANISHKQILALKIIKNKKNSKLSNSHQN